MELGRPSKQARKRKSDGRVFFPARARRIDQEAEGTECARERKREREVESERSGNRAT
jgi:hypothetical protein